MLALVVGRFGELWRLRRRSRDLGELSAAVAAAQESARHAAASANMAVELLRGLEEHQQDATPERFRRLLAVCLVLALLIVVGYWLLIPAFADPAPRDTRPGGVQVAIEQRDVDDGAYQTALRSVVVTSELHEVDGNASYHISIPVNFEGYEFKILLAGSAVIDDLPLILADDFDVERSQCSGEGLIPNAYLANSECQVFTGTVGGEFKGLLQECRDEENTQFDGEYFEFRVWGTSEATERIDWAHSISNVPDVSGLFGSDPVHSWGGMTFDRPMSLALGTSCQDFKFSEARTGHSSSAEPSETWASGYSWGPNYWSPRIAVVSTSREAAVIGNLLLGLIGVLSAVLIGLVSVTYQAWEAHRRFLRVRETSR